MIPNRWYAVEASSRLGRRPRALRRMGERLVLWRGPGGAPVAMRDRCPHRGAALSRGQVVGGELACPYHGFRFDAGGACTRMPCEGPGARIPRGMEVATLPCREAHGLLWLWWGEPRGALPEIPWFDELERMHSSAGSAVCWDIPYERLLESHFDFHHLPFVHRHAGGFGVGPRLDPYEVASGADWIETRGTLRHEGRPDGLDFRIEYKAPNLVFFELSERLRFTAITTPIDAEHSWLYARYYQDYVKLPLLGPAFAWLALQIDWKIFQNLQDLPVLRSLEPRHGGPGVNRFVRADAGSAAFVRMRERLRAEGEKPEARAAEGR